MNWIFGLGVKFEAMDIEMVSLDFKHMYSDVIKDASVLEKVP